MVGGSTMMPARELDTRYTQLGIGHHRCGNIVLPHDYNTKRILTLDSHCRAVEPWSRDPVFRLLPTDG